jgi:hypothetical protein
MVEVINIDSSNSDCYVATAAANRVSMKQSNTFPFRLHEMLDTMAQEGSESIVSWCAGNHTAFKVHKPQEFVKTIMPRFFQQTKYKSFQRQCNLWGYERILHGPEKGGYEHPDGFFVRGYPSLVNKMVRRKIKRPSSVDRTDATHASSSSLEAIITPDPVQVTVAPSVLPPEDYIAAAQRRPSVVSCSSGNNSVVVTTAFQSQGNYNAESSAVTVAPVTPLVTSYYGSSAETTPCVDDDGDDPEGLYLPPSPASSQQDENFEDVAAGDTLFFEGLSAFFEDDDQASCTLPLFHMAPSVPQLHPPQYLPPTIAAHRQQQHRLEPKRRLSVELFVASRQPNSNERFLDLLSDSDSLQKSLEMELKCPCSSIRSAS